MTMTIRSSTLASWTQKIRQPGPVRRLTRAEIERLYPNTKMKQGDAHGNAQGQVEQH
jgi:hypothetical protein